MTNIGRFRNWVQDMTRLVDAKGGDERAMHDEGSKLLSALVSADDWLPDAFAVPSSESYRQYLLYCDPLERFSAVSFVWQPGQRTPVHDHTVWGLIGVLRGAESSERFELAGDGLPMRSLGIERLERGAVDFVSPTVGDIHRVSNDVADRVSISIHVYGADIGQVQRSVFDPQTGARKSFVSGYANASAG